MMGNYNYWAGTPGMMWGNFGGSFLGFFLLPLIIWSLVWKGWALWLAARNGSKWWFIALLIINTAGILDIIYIFFFGKKLARGSSRKR